MLTHSEFNILYFLKRNGSNPVSQRALARTLNLSLGKVNALLNNLSDKSLLSAQEASYQLTSQGENALNEYKVDNAIIMAAGMSSRFAPLSYEKPKGLLKVKGELLIEREIKQLQDAGIDDITVVVGYMKEKFFYLEEKYHVKIVINEDYYRYNNTSSLIRVTDQLANTYICSSDNYFVDNVFEPYVYQGYYAAVYAPQETDEYCLSCDTHGRIKKVTIGGANSWYMCGHVYFDKHFSQKFKAILTREYSNQATRELLWENLYMRYINELDLYIKKYDANKLLEFDSLNELRSFDPAYINNIDSTIFQNICKTLSCEAKDVEEIYPIKAGLTNTSFQFSVHGQKYVYRHPGRGTERYINRCNEATSMEVATGLGLDDTFIQMDSSSGWKISKYIEDVRELDYHNLAEVTQALSMMRTLHASHMNVNYDFNIWNKTKDFISVLQAEDKSDFEGFEELYQSICAVHDMVINDHYVTKCLCHNDCYSPNFLLDRNNNMYLIDWEYSGNDDPASDLGTFICCSDYSYEEALKTIELYLEHTPSTEEAKHYIGYIAIASYYWYVWALYQETRGNSVGEWLYLWYKNSIFYAEKALR